MPRKVTTADLMRMAGEGAAIELPDRDLPPDPLPGLIQELIESNRQAMARQESLLSQLTEMMANLNVEAGEVDLTPVRDLIAKINTPQPYREVEAFDVERNNRGDMTRVKLVYSQERDNGRV